MQHIVETIGAKPILLTSGAVFTGAGAISITSIVVGVLVLLNISGILPVGYASLEAFGLGGGIALTAGGSAGILLSSGLFILILRSVKPTPQLQSEGISENLEIDTSSLKEISLEDLYQQLDAFVEQRGDMDFLKKHNVFYATMRHFENKLYLSIYESSHNNDILIGRKREFILKDTTRTELTNGVFNHLKTNYSDDVCKTNFDAFIFGFEKKED